MTHSESCFFFELSMLTQIEIHYKNRLCIDKRSIMEERRREKNHEKTTYYADNSIPTRGMCLIK